jgi:hypothetical protein
MCLSGVSPARSYATRLLLRQLLHDDRRRYPQEQLLRINDELMQLCKRLNEKRDMETSSRLIPLVDDLTYILIEAGKNKLPLMQ